MECEPDEIFIGGCLSASYDALSEIASVIYLSTNSEIGLVESVTKNATTIASLFGMESEIEKKTADFAERIAALQAVAQNPDYIFVMDRDRAIGTEGVQLAQEIMENELVMSTDAYKNGNIVYLEHPAVWYTAEGGITALDVMLQDLESTLLE